MRTLRRYRCGPEPGHLERPQAGMLAYASKRGPRRRLIASTTPATGGESRARLPTPQWPHSRARRRRRSATPVQMPCAHRSDQRRTVTCKPAYGSPTSPLVPLLPPDDTQRQHLRASATAESMAGGVGPAASCHPDPCSARRTEPTAEAGRRTTPGRLVGHARYFPRASWPLRRMHQPPTAAEDDEARPVVGGPQQCDRRSNAGPAPGRSSCRGAPLRSADRSRVARRA